MFAKIIDFFQKLTISMFSGFANKKQCSDITHISIAKNKRSIMKNVHIMNHTTKGTVNIKRNVDCKIEDLGIE